MMSKILAAHVIYNNCFQIYINYISDGLRKEYGSKGIIVQVYISLRFLWGSISYQVLVWEATPNLIDERQPDILFL